MDEWRKTVGTSVLKNDEKYGKNGEAEFVI
jgi:hypothetical protein